MNIIMDYKSKYLKYKSKYYKLQEQLGSSDDPEVDGLKCKTLMDDNAAKACLIKAGGEFLREKISQFEHICLLNKKESRKYSIDPTTSNICGNTHSFDWNSYKEKYDDEKKSLIYQFRTNIVDGLINFIFRNYGPCHNPGMICNFNASGSIPPEATLDSDYDLTLSGNYKISVIIQIFNSIFKTEFGKTSAEFFDTNLYGYSFLISKAGVQGNKLWTLINSNEKKPHEENKLCGLVTTETKSSEQDRWAYLRLKSYITSSLPKYLIGCGKDCILKLVNEVYNKEFEII